MPPSAPGPPARALPQWVVSYPNAARGARGHYADEAESVLTAMPPPSQRYHTVQALSHLRSDGIPLRTPLRKATRALPLPGPLSVRKRPFAV